MIIPKNLYNSVETFSEYNLAKFYEEYVLQKTFYPYQFDAWKEKKLYGFIDNNGNIIYPKTTSLASYNNNNGQKHYNINFVTDAFKDLKNYNLNLKIYDRISDASLFSALNVVKSTELSHQTYITYINKILEIFKNSYLTLENKKKIVDIYSFTKHFIKFLTILCKVVPFHRSTYMKSKHVDFHSNGLTISFADVSYEVNYRNKANLFIENPHFDNYVTTAAKHGFFVDRNNPHRIIADLESPVMKKYAADRGFLNTDSIFQNLYYKAYEADTESFVNIIISFWNWYVTNEQLLSGKVDRVNYIHLFNQVNNLNQISFDTFNRYFDINWQLRFYLYIKIIEEKIKTTQNKFELIFKEACILNKYKDIYTSLAFLNEKIKELAKQELVPNDDSLTDPNVMLRMLSTEITRNLPAEDIIF